ncbi:MAG: hypothetical protein UV42_C0018G0018, partial [Candidatus Magasanikbacteria bacterium GW2011_GWE2_42_7]
QGHQEMLAIVRYLYSMLRLRIGLIEGQRHARYQDAAIAPVLVNRRQKMSPQPSQY